MTSGTHLSLSKGRRLGPYEILAPLGSGGMGEVYRARDNKLDRDVAIKVLPLSVAGDPETLARFEREAKAVAALSHPNILAIHDFGNQDGVAYAVMELLEGETLRSKLEGGAIPQKQAVDYALQVAKGLSAAHERGVVHRDLKPENLFVSKDGHLKILDFGLAKKVEPVAAADETSAPTASGHTEPGTVMGTVGYMSPEQVRGLQVDNRSDIFAFGAILYELLSGKRAFRRDTAADTMAAILKEEPPELAALKPKISPSLDQVVRRCLEKDKSQRFHSVHDLAFALKDASSAVVVAEPPAPRAASAKAPRQSFILVWGSMLAVLIGLAIAVVRIRAWNTSITSLAVLPFANASADPNVEYLNDGITDSLINSFSQLPRLKVMSRDSVAGYKKRDASAQVAGRELKVQAVLKGQFLQHDQDLSITAELVDVRDNTHLWGGRFTRKLSEMQAVQDEIATQISAKLRAGLSGDEKKRLTRRYTDDPEAYQLYLKGRYFFEKRTEEQIKKSIDFFTQAIDRDPGYALAYAGLANAYVVSTSYSYLSPGDCIPKGKAAAGRALEIDDGIAQAHAALAWALWSYDWNFADAEQEMKRATELNPNDATAHLWYGMMLTSFGRTANAVKELRRAIEIDPFSKTLQMNLARAYVYGRQFDRAIEEARKAPDFPLAFNRLGDAYSAMGMPKQAAQEYRKAAEISGKNAQGIWFRGQAEAVDGQRQDALRTIDEMKAMSTQRYIQPAYIAALYVRLNERDQAFQWLERAFEDHSFDLVFLGVAPVWDPLRADPRFRDLLRRVNQIT